MKEIRNIVLLLFIIISITCYSINDYYKQTDTFMSPGEIESASGNMEITDGRCSKPNDPKYVGENYSICCNEQSMNCMCKVSSLQSCVNNYKTCFDTKSEKFKLERKRKEDNVEKLKTEIIELETKINKGRNPLILGSLKSKLESKKKLVRIMETELEEEPIIPAGIQKQCQLEFAKCSKSKIGELPRDKYNTNIFKQTSMKRNIDGNRICEVELENNNEYPLCVNYCDNINNCQGIIYNKITGICELFDKPLQDKEPSAKNGDGNYISFMKINNINENINGNNNINENINGNNNIEEFQNNNKNNKIEKVLDKIDKKKKGYKTCKSTYNNNLQQLKESHEFQKLNLPTNIEPGFNSEICRRYNISFNNCKDECLLNSNCDYLMYGNPNDKSELNNTKYYLSTGKKCVLYTGPPSLEGENITLSKINSGSGFNYYIKKFIPVENRNFE